MVHLRVIKRGKGRNYSNAKRLRPANQSVRQHAPSALRVANSHRAGEAIDGYGQFHAVFQNFVRQGVWNLDSARSPVMTVAAIGDVGPAFEHDSPAVPFFYDVEPTSQADEVS